MILQHRLEAPGPPYCTNSRSTYALCHTSHADARGGYESNAMDFLLPKLALAIAYPRVGVHTGDNRVVWQSGCCDGDLIVIDFRDENGDGNQGSGLLRLQNSTDNSTLTYEIGSFWGLHRAFGPYCAPAGRHSISFTSDSNAVETTVKITDSFGLIKARGGMDDFPLEFNTTAPAKFCIPADLGGQALPEELKFERARKLVRRARMLRRCARP